MNALHALSGFFNFVVFSATRPEMVFGRPVPPPPPHAIPSQPATPLQQLNPVPPQNAQNAIAVPQNPTP